VTIGSELLLGVDVGTYSAKAALVTPDGRIVSEATAPHDLEVPRPGWAEQDADRIWWSSLVAVTREVLARSEVEPGRIAGVGVSAIGPCMLPLDRGNRPLRPGILYGIDTRATAEIEELERAIGPETIRSRFRMDLSSQAVGPKIRWYRNQEPDRWEQTQTITTASSYLVYRLTGQLAIDHHQAAHFMPLYDPATQRWTDEYSEAVGSLGLLPPVGWSDAVAGGVTQEAAAMTGLPAGTPVVVGGVDALLEALGAGVHQPGDLMIMYGSTAFLVLMTREGVARPPLWSLPGLVEGSSVLAGGMATTGAATRWFVDVLGGGTGDYESLFRAASDVPPGSDGLLVLPYFSGERTPLNDPLARGLVVGLSLAHGREHIFRAILEGVAFGIHQNIRLLDAPDTPVERCVAVGGGTTSDGWMQIVSDVTGRRQEVPRRTMGAALGDAFVAGMGAGLLTLEDLGTWAPVDRTVDPNVGLRRLYDARHELFGALYERTREVVHELASQQDGDPALDGRTDESRRVDPTP
jgi:xylulokinase